MNWIRKTVIFIALLIAGLFAYHADTASVHITETQKRILISVKRLEIHLHLFSRKAVINLRQTSKLPHLGY